MDFISSLEIQAKINHLTCHDYLYVQCRPHNGTENDNSQREKYYSQIRNEEKKASKLKTFECDKEVFS